MKKKFKILDTNKILIIIAIITLILLIYFSINNPFKISGKATTSGNTAGTTSQVIITKENFIPSLQNSQLVKDLPKEAVISLRFYNFNTGQRQWEQSYTITKNNVQLGEINNPDLEIILHSKYLPELSDFCNTIQKAKANGDIAFDLKISNTKFLWKYKSMMEYRNCFGF